MINIQQKSAQLKGQYLAYIRVSTPKQGEGVSLLTQREGIARFAAERRLLVTGWYEEKETAARRGRPVFRNIISLIRKGKADGLIVHKVDRSARNLKDWADLGELIDQGIPVYFAGEGIDMSTRSGRLAADIQAVVAADYIRNLREEAKRGIQKRLEQGFLPHNAPIGYLNCGGGKPKLLDPERAPLIRLAFTWYATGDYTLRTLAAFLYDLGLRSIYGRRITVGCLSRIFRTTFYMGYVESKSEAKLYAGRHEALVTRELFFAVQSHLRARVSPRRVKHEFRYRRMLRCLTCGKYLHGSERKGHVYYRCATMTCPTVSIREDRVTTSIDVRGSLAEKGIACNRPVAVTSSENDVSHSNARALQSARPNHLPEPLSQLHPSLQTSAGRDS